MRRLLFEGIILFGILSLAFLMALLPRLDYPLPLHVDEWIHVAHTQWIVASESLSYLDPFAGGRETSSGNLEIGYDIWLGELLIATGVAWPILNRLVIAITSALIVFLCYAWCRRWHFGLEAAFFVTFIPTDNRLMGPAFMVPVVLGLAFLPLVLILLDKYEYEWKPFLLIPLAFGALWFIHGLAAVVVGVVIAIFMMLGLVVRRPGWPHCRWWMATLLVLPGTGLAVLALKPAFLEYAISMLFLEQYTGPDSIPAVIPEVGYVPLILLPLGILALVARGGWRNRALAASAAILLVYVLGYRRVFDLGPLLLQRRTWLFTFLVVAITIGYALYTIRQVVGGRIKKEALAAPLAALAVVLVAGLSLADRIEGVRKGYYYHLLGAQMYSDFVFVREKLHNQSVVMLNPYLARALPAVAGKYAYQAASSPYGEEEYALTRKFFAEGATDTPWMAERRIDILYSPVPLKNPDLVGIRDGGAYKMYIVPENIAGAQVPLPGWR